MIRVSVKQAVKTLEKASEQLGSRKFNQALTRALNESILQGRTEARSAVKAVYNIPQRYVNRINVKKATPQTLTAHIFASKMPIPMDAFAPRFTQAGKSITITRRGEQKSRTVKRAKGVAGVSIEVLKGKREVVPHSFMIEGGKPRVFARGQYKRGSYGFVFRNKRVNKEGSDIPIKPLLSVTVHAAVTNKKALAKVQAKLNTVFPVSVERNIKHLLNGVGS
ncbi:MAG TPA: hypothetical protein VGE79_08950 [Niastella sp.]